MNALLFLAATAAPVANQSDGWLTPNGIAVILGALGGFALILLRDKIRQVRLAPGSELTTNDGPPTRREIDKMEAVFTRTMQAMEASAVRTDKRITNQNANLTKKINEVASGCYLGRQKIWVVTNSHGERIARLEERSDMVETLTSLVENIHTTAAPKVTPTHPHTNA
jgi:hypothetical protein